MAGIPVYTSNLAAMPLVGGLMAQSMHPAVALAFLIAGPTTTLPAMSAVWGMVNRRVFAVYWCWDIFSALLYEHEYLQHKASAKGRGFRIIDHSWVIKEKSND